MQRYYGPVRVRRAAAAMFVVLLHGSLEMDVLPMGSVVWQAGPPGLP